jgi:hypothetical protein
MQPAEIPVVPKELPNGVKTLPCGKLASKNARLSVNSDDSPEKINFLEVA